MNKVLIVGLGLIGGSYAMGLTKNGYEVYAITRTYDSIKFAKENGYIKDGYTEVKEEIIKDFDFIIFSLYPKIFIKWIKQYKNFFKKGTLITDVTGVKGSVVYEIYNELKGTKVEFVPHHPMAGREVYGVRNADDNIFKKANFIVTPFKDSKEESIKRIENLGKTLGFKTISRLSIEEHDEMIAYLSQLTHVIAVSLMTAKENSHLKDYTGDSFRDLTRIANINEDMWTELFLMNKEKLLKEIDLFIGEISTLRDLIDNEDVELLKDKMRLSTKRRSYFNKD
ncbi:MAG: prephenate dehydrogenase [Gammaproteobacteria bacterium]|nr:prephenate dehydrogenase [Gammaproteobacteria bacterium]